MSAKGRAVFSVFFCSLAIVPIFLNQWDIATLCIACACYHRIVQLLTINGAVGAA